ncbi:DUF6476 family protein [Paracoccus tegillarcae]|uniref:Uncharacterized protein n=1 Tax=Paracoccus tegillarcae TaxID=1529068 RepID=A0A2K9EIP5_9RHOB|nr:DUF6476 family protein [Paracoccus tegillarcae]AUH34850.1 hypothetical protein CUV01_17005 [Paracoccus tegillarcae]
MDQEDRGWTSAAELRWLKMLVTGLSVVMGLGMIAIVALLWIRLSQPMLPDLPTNIVLPDGASVQAVTFARDFIVVVTDAGEVLLYDQSGAMISRVQP